MSVAQAYVDEDVQETLYACAWTTSIVASPILVARVFDAALSPPHPPCPSPPVASATVTAFRIGFGHGD